MANDPVVARTKSVARPLGALLLFSIVFFGCYAGFAPLDFSLPEAGLDASWSAVLGEAAGRNLRFGEDIIFTGGPLSPLYTRYFQSDRFALNLVLCLLLTTAVALPATLLAWKNHRTWPALLLLVVAMSMSYPRDALFFSLPLLTGLLAVSGARGGFVAAASLLGTLAAAVASLAKFSVMPLAVLSFLLADVSRLYERRVPFHTVAYLLATFALFGWLEDPLRFIPFLAASFSVSSGHTAAMFLPGSIYELAGFLLAALFFFGTLTYTEIIALAGGLAKWPAVAARFLIFAAFLFMVWKAGFVRQDVHTFISWSGLALAAATYLIAAPCTALGFARAAGLSLLSFLAIFVIIPWVWSAYARESPMQLIQFRLGNVGRQLATARDFIADPAGRIDALRRAKEEAWARVRTAQPLPRLDGGVDVIPSMQASVLANGLDYRPRFSIQEFLTYTASLIEANRRFLVERGPAYLLFQPGSIDGRHPASAEGPLWPDIIRYYRPYERFAGLAILRRREHPLPGEILGPPVGHSVNFGDSVRLPVSADPQFMTARIRSTLFGRIADLLWRPSLVHMQVTYADGAQQTYRIIPEISSGGFFLSPLVAGADDFVLIATGRSDGLLPMVRRVAFQTSSVGGLMYEKTVDVTFRSLASRVLREQTSSDPTINRMLEEASGLALLGASASRPDAVRMIPQGLLAQAPVELTKALSRDASGLGVGFGIAAGAWTPADGTDGVCFEIDRQRGDQTANLLTRCLDPKRVEADRVEQDVELRGDFKAGDVIRLRTRCRQGCAYGWSYWSKLEIVDPS